MSVENTHKMFSCENFAEISKQTLMEMLTYAEEGLFCDVTLIAGEDGTKIATHRAVLSARNAYFKSMFNSQFKEAYNKEVTISEVSGDILQSLIRYCYTGSIEINEDNVQLILPHASMMIFPEIVEACSSFQITSINPANCLCMAKYAKLYNLTDLLKSAEKHMKSNFTNVVATDGFLKLNEEELQEYLSFDGLNVVCEKDKFDAMIRWIDYNSKTQSSALSKLLSLIQLHKIEKNYLFDFVLNNTRKEYFLPLINGIKENLSNTQIKDKANKIVVICDKHIQVYNPSSNVVEFKCSVFSDYDDFKPTLVGEKVILVYANGIVRCFDVNTNAWYDLPSMLIERKWSSVATLNNCVYVVGGFGNSKTFNTVERLNSKLNKWNYVASMNHQRRNHCTAILNGKLYAIGGYGNRRFLNSVECYNPVTNKWSICSPMLTKRSRASAVVVNDELFVFGGITNNSQTLNLIEKYNPVKNTWTQVAKMCYEKSQIGAYLLNNKIYLLGGYNFKNNEWLKSMEEFDLARKKCKLIDSANIKIGGNMYCFPVI